MLTILYSRKAVVLSIEKDTMRMPATIERLLHLKLEGDNLSNLVETSLESLWGLPSNLSIFCEEGSVVFTNKRYLGLFSKLIRDTCQDVPEDEMTTIIVQYSKFKMEQLLNFLRCGNLRADTFEDLKEIADMLTVFQVPINETEILSPPKILQHQKVLKRGRPSAVTQTSIKVELSYDAAQVDTTEEQLDSFNGSNESSDFDMTSSNDEAEDVKMETPKMLSKHIRQPHTDTEKKHKCEECGASFAHRSTLTNHMGVHNPIQCQHCSKKFAQKAGFRNHLRIQHNIDLEK